MVSVRGLNRNVLPRRQGITREGPKSDSPREAIPRTFERFSPNLKQHKPRSVCLCAAKVCAKSFIKALEIETTRASPFGNAGTSRRARPYPIALPRTAAE